MDKAEKKHERILNELVDRLWFEYGHDDIRKHVNYYSPEGDLLGEFDVMVVTPESVRVYEVKGSHRGFPHGRDQMSRAQDNVDYWLDNNDLNTHYMLVTQDKYRQWIVRRH